MNQEANRQSSHTQNRRKHAQTTSAPWHSFASLSSLVTARRALLALLALGIGLRLWLVVINQIDPTSSTADDGDYYRRALRLAVTGQYLDDSWLIRPPGHIFFFAPWLWVGVELGNLDLGLLLIKLAQVGLSALQIAFGYGVAARLFRNQWAGVLFALFLAVWYPFVEQPSLLFSELLFATLFLAHLWLLLCFDASGKLWNLALSGALLGLASLTRSPALYSVAFVFMWLFVRWWVKRTSTAKPARSLFQPIIQSLVIGTCTLAVVLPWTARNYVTYGHVIPVDTLGQVNLWLDLEEPALRNGKIEEMRAMPQADRAAYAMGKAREILARDPLALTRNIWPHFQHIWKAQFVEDYYLRESFYDRPLRQAAPLGLAGDMMWLVLTAAGLAGLASPPREGWHNRLFALAWIGYTLFTVVVFHVEPRYLLPLWTLIALYGSGKLVQWLGGPQQVIDSEQTANNRLSAVGRRSSVVIQCVMLLVFAVLLLSYRNYPAIIARGEAREQAMRSGDAALARNQGALAEQAYDRALDAQPNFLDGKVSLALAQLAQNKRAEAAATVSGVARRTATVVELVAQGGEPDDIADITYAEATTGLDIQRWAIDMTTPQPTRGVQLGSGRDLGYVAGFSAAEADGITPFRWMHRQGFVRLPLAAPLEAGETLALRLAAPTNTPVTVTIGATKQTIEIMPGQWRTYLLPIPSTPTGQPALEVTLDAPPFIPAAHDHTSNDLRELSIMVSSVFIQ